MFDDLFNPTHGVADDEAFDIMRELEQNTPDEIRRQRKHFRIAIKSKLILQPGNASDLLNAGVQGITGDVSEGGCSGLFPIAPRVGDIYRLSFDQHELGIPMTFARCVRCRLVREDAFEAGFRFFANIPLPEKVSAAQATGLA